MDIWLFTDTMKPLFLKYFIEMNSNDLGISIYTMSFFYLSD